MAHLAGFSTYPNYPGFPNFEGMEAVKAAACENVYVDTASHWVYACPGVMEQMVDLIGPDHIVYGTDVPLIGPKQMRFTIEAIVGLGLSQESQDKILYGNSKRLLGL
jgi:predicted TIM-barrel fold metal-dependent hydrolase